MPLTHERYRICELYSELLHCSNMSLLNRPQGYGPTYDGEGRLQGGLAALEDLARVIASSSNEEQEASAYRSHSLDPSSPSDSRELPVSVDSTDCSSIVSDSDSDDSSSDLGDHLDDTDITDHGFRDSAPSPPNHSPALNGYSASASVPSGPSPQPSPPPENPENSQTVDSIDPFIDPMPLSASPLADAPISNFTNQLPAAPDISNPNRSHDPPSGLSPGDHFKWRLLDLGVLSTLLVCPIFWNLRI